MQTLLEGGGSMCGRIHTPLGASWLPERPRLGKFSRSFTQVLRDGHAAPARRSHASQA